MPRIGETPTLGLIRRSAIAFDWRIFKAVKSKNQSDALMQIQIYNKVSIHFYCLKSSPIECTRARFYSGYAFDWGAFEAVKKERRTVIDLDLHQCVVPFLFNFYCFENSPIERTRAPPYKTQRGSLTNPSVSLGACLVMVTVSPSNFTAKSKRQVPCLTSTKHSVMCADRLRARTQWLRYDSRMHS